MRKEREQRETGNVRIRECRGPERLREERRLMEGEMRDDSCGRFMEAKKHD